MPTLKQIKAIENVVENGGNVSKAMKDAGYSEATAKTPQKLTESKAWLELMEEHLSDQKLTEKHEAFLNSENEAVGIKALDLAYKLKGSYAPDKNLNVNVEVKTIDDEAIEKLAELLNEQARVHEGTSQPSDGKNTDAMDKETQDKD